ncbi:MAG: DUF362 domain-containing protein [Promethearchaeota archaeon]
MDSVALVKYEGNIRETLMKGLSLIGGFGTLRSPILIKPNICTQSDNTGFSVTDVNIVATLIDILLETDQGLSIHGVESDSESKWAEKAYEKFGYTQLAKNLQKAGYNVSIVNLSKSSKISVPFKGKYFQNPELPEELVQAGYVISVAVAKTHYLTFITGVLKNLFGLLPRKDQSYYHSQIASVIVDLNRLVSPNLCVIDARMGIEGWNGPKKRPLNTFIVGQKPVSVDATMCRLMGFEPERIRHIIEASTHDLGVLNPTLRGQSIDSLIVQFNRPIINPSALIDTET